MARSAKQLAFFKRVVDEAGLCGKPGKDVFEYEIRLARAVKTARAMRERLRLKRGRRHDDAYARKHDFKDMAAMRAAAEAGKFVPYATAAARRKKIKASQRDTKVKKSKGTPKRPPENLSWRKQYVEEREFHNAM